MERLRRNRKLFKIRTPFTPTNEQLRCLTELSNNILHKRVAVKPKQLSKLRRHKKVLRALALKKISFKQKRQLLKRQKGGFLSLLLPVLGSVVSGLLGSLTRK